MSLINISIILFLIKKWGERWADGVVVEQSSGIGRESGIRVRAGTGAGWGGRGHYNIVVRFIFRATMEEITHYEEKFVTIDDIIPYIGEFKKFQWILGAMFCTIVFPSTFPILIMVFGALDPRWRCANNSTVCLNNGTFSPEDPLRCSLPRGEWEYTEPKEYSIVTWFDIYCDSSWLIQVSTSIIFIGGGVGGILVGWAADNYGRKNVIFISVTMSILCGFLASLMPNIYFFIAFRFIIGLFMAGTNYQMSILLSEIVACKYRPHAGILVWIFFSVALCLLSLKAYFIRSWKTLFIVCSVPYVFVLLFYKFAPESPRWLRLQGKLDELMETLQRIADINNKVIPSHLSILPAEKGLQQRKSSPLLLFRTRRISKMTLVMSYGGMIHGMVYYGIHMAASDLGGSLYLNFFLLSFIEIPATAFAVFLCDKCGRKFPTVVGVLCAGISCVILAFLPMKIKVVRVIIGMIGKLCITISFNTFGLWSIELFPTEVRGQAMGIGSLATTLGASSAPWLVSGLATLHYSGPYLCMSIVSLICAGLCLLLSETKGLSTLETVEDLQKGLVERQLFIDSEVLLTSQT